MTALVGLDLAWSGRNPSGYCVLRADQGGRVALEALGDCVMPPAEALQWLGSLGPDVVAAIDAPLIIGPGRKAEAAMALAYPGTGLRAYSARWDFLSRHGITAGPELGALLDADGWTLDPTLVTPGTAGRWALEVFPHSVVVSLLGCPKLLRYKKGPRVERLEAFVSYQALMQAFARLMLGRPCAERLDAVLGANASLLRGKALKAHEDRLDAVACALVAWVAFRQGAAGLEVFGDASDGYITAPALHAVRGGHAHQAEDACEGDLRGEHEAQARFR